MKRVKFVSRIVVFAVLASVSSSCNSSNTVTVSTPSSSPVEAPPRCSQAAGYIWANVTLYRDSACKEPFAKIVSASREQVVIQLDSGGVETQNRDAIKRQVYVMTNDPAMP
ncbi:hypothetical protein H6F98_00890 [Microcoleus sp. FACHB-SPT15]|uniref:hypothetical protein n=1 Tax=Microcoleus sp. FACHB-SPT15 TaxID=2692830 RepID=UPI00177AA829|nr:hypothetical protein [Microcoleus sp. FACHB-SPT15]MBD1804030.1 hypothetical protein [Microcoleus sp. FACHB-SPT15]